MNKKALNIIISIIGFILIGTLAFSCFTIKTKNSYIKSLNSQIEENLDLLENHLTIQRELEEKIKAGESNLEKANSELEQAKQELEKSKAEIDRILKENSTLKYKIEQLKLQKSQTEKVCYLTFDDGPSDNTLKVLNILDEYNVKATFFVIKNSKSDYIKTAALKGHTIGLHTASHSYPDIYSSEDAYYADLKAVSDIVEAQTGKKSNIIRFPGGSSNKISSQYSVGLMTKLTKSVVDSGYYYYDWNVDSGDASGNNVRPAIIRNNVLKSAKGKMSICVLMHDTSSKSTTVQALPGIIEGLTSMGYRFAALTEDSFGFRHGELNN